MIRETYDAIADAVAFSRWALIPAWTVLIGLPSFIVAVILEAL